MHTPSLTTWRQGEGQQDTAKDMLGPGNAKRIHSAQNWLMGCFTNKNRTHMGIYFFFFCMCGSHLSQRDCSSMKREITENNWMLDPLWRAEHSVSPISTCSRVVPKLETIRILLETIYSTLIGLAALQTSAMYHLVDHFLTAFFPFNTKNNCTSMVHLFYITFTTDTVRN